LGSDGMAALAVSSAAANAIAAVATRFGRPAKPHGVIGI
jgi:hypothetical protein